MPLSPWYVGTVSPAWQLTLDTDTGGVDLTGVSASALSVIFYNQGTNIGTPGTGVFSIVQASPPAVIQYQPSSADVATAGTYLLYFTAAGKEAFDPVAFQLVAPSATVAVGSSSPKYLTPTHYRLSDDFPLTADITDLLLARTIQRAEADIDSYMEFDLRLGGFEPRTGWVESQWDPQTRRIRVPNAPVPIRRALKYQIQVANLSNTGAPFVAIINNQDVAYNVFDDYVEIVPLTSITYSLAPVLTALGLNPPIVQLDYEAGYYLPVYNETLYPLNPLNGAESTYVALRAFWASSYTLAPSIQPQVPPPVPPNIYVNGVLQTTGYAINYKEGQVTFTPALTGNPVVSADYTYTIPDNVRSACIDQVSYLLGKRALNKQGMAGLAMARNGDVEIRTIDSYPARFPSNVGALCDSAAHKLENYIGIPVA